jgi:transposase
MRKSFDGLAQLVRQYLGVDPLSGHLFVFRSRRGDRLKLLYWDQGGYVIFYKRLEKGTFRFPPPTLDGNGIEISAVDLTMLLDGVDLTTVKRQARYQRPVPLDP